MAGFLPTQSLNWMRSNNYKEIESCLLPTEMDI